MYLSTLFPEPPEYKSCSTHAKQLVSFTPGWHTRSHPAVRPVKPLVPDTTEEQAWLTQAHSWASASKQTSKTTMSCTCRSRARRGGRPPSQLAERGISMQRAWREWSLSGLLIQTWWDLFGQRLLGAMEYQCFISHFHTHGCTQSLSYLKWRSQTHARGHGEKKSCHFWPKCMFVMHT